MQSGLIMGPPGTWISMFNARVDKLNVRHRCTSCTHRGMDEIPVVDFSSLSLSVDGEKLNECDLKAAAQQFINAFNTFGAVRLYNTGLHEEMVRVDCRDLRRDAEIAGLDIAGLDNYGYLEDTLSLDKIIGLNAVNYINSAHRL